MNDELDFALAKIANSTVRNREKIENTNTQRRNLVTDDFDKEYSCVGEEGVTGDIWLAISPDMLYMERWEFKVIVEPFEVPLASGEKALTPASLTIPPVDLTISDTSLSATIADGNTVNIEPNPHTHEITPSTLNLNITPNPHSHSANAGVTLHPSNFSDLHILLDGHDFTAAFKAQFPNWIGGEGMFPDISMGNRYNILQALSTLPKGDESAFLQQGYHKLQFQANGLFHIKIREFKKYSFLNRQGDSIE